MTAQDTVITDLLTSSQIDPADAAVATLGTSIDAFKQVVGDGGAASMPIGAYIDRMGSEDRAGMLGPVDSVMAYTPPPIPDHLLPRHTMPIEIAPELVQLLAAEVAPLLADAVTQSVAQAVADVLASQEGE